MRPVTIVPRAANGGIAAADEEHDVVVLGDGVESLEDGWLEKLREAAYSDASAGIVGCRLVDGEGRLLHAGTYVLPDTLQVQHIGFGELDLGQYVDTRVVEGIDFACAYIRREVLRDVGPSLEDADYCLRAAERGWKTLCCGAVTMRCDAAPAAKSLDRQWAAKLERRYTSSLAWQSIMNVPSGYGTSVREMMRVLDERGTRITYSYAYGPGTPLPLPEPELPADHRLEVIRRRHEATRPPVVITYAKANIFHRNHGAYRIGFTMLEVDGVPPPWVRRANEMDEIWVPTEPSRQGLLRSGVTKPVHVVPLGVDPDHYHPATRRIPNPNGDYVFLAAFEWSERKAPEVLLKVFNETFRADEPVLLVCKTMNLNARLDLPNEIRALGLDESGGRIYFLHNRELPHYQLAALYRSADCFVSPARGEGWGLPVLEAMACGLPVIATDWGGHTAFLNPDDTYPLRPRAIIPAVSLCPEHEGFSWADPDPQQLAELLRHVFENQDEAREKGLRASRRVRSTLTWTETAKVIEGHLARIG